MEVDAPRVGIVMGSKSDMPEMEKAAQELEERGIHYEVRVMSAHREPDIVAEYAKNAHMRGLRVIIAGAGLSAALPGVVAAHTDLPVIGVPLTSRSRPPAASTRCSRSRRCRRACRWPASASTARATRRSSPRGSSAPERCRSGRSGSLLSCARSGSSTSRTASWRRAVAFARASNSGSMTPRSTDHAAHHFGARSAGATLDA